ncbi:MAG: hypothetical protein ACYC2O_06815 [Microthrixaceae bacterium]
MSETLAPTTPAAEVQHRLIDLGRRWSRHQHELCRLLAFYERSGHWVSSGATSCTAWAADALEVERGTVREWLRVGHAMFALADVDAAFADGLLSYSKVRALTRVAIDHPDRQSELIELAAGSTAAALPWELARWTGREEDPEERDRRHRRETALTVRTEPDGAVVISARVPPLEGAMVMRTIDAHVGRVGNSGPTANTERGEDAPADASSPPSVDDTPRRSLARRRAEAFTDLLGGDVAGAWVGGPAGGRRGPLGELVIHLRGDGATLEDGTPIAGHVVERIAPASFLRVLIHDAERRPINASGRQRHPTLRQQRVVAERDGHACSEPKCSSRAFLDFDHDPPFAESKHTVIDELTLRCAFHHRGRHRAEE